MSNFDKMLALFKTQKFNLKNLKKQYKEKSLETHPDRGGKEEDFLSLTASYSLLLPLIEGTISKKQLSNINEELNSSSLQTRQEILSQIKTVNTYAFIFLTQNEEQTKEWISINTNVLNGNIFSKKNFDSMLNISRSKYSTFFMPYTSKEEVFSEIANIITSSLKLFIYLLLSVSVVDYLLTSVIFLVLHDSVDLDESALNDDRNSLSYCLKMILYSTLLDALFTLINPVINLLSLVIRSGMTLATNVDSYHDVDETYETPLALTIN